MLPLIVFSMLLGLALVSLPEAARVSVVTLFRGVADAMLVLVRWLLVVAPIGVFARKSTEAIAVSDTEIAEAMRFIRDHACEGIGVEDVLKVVPISRTVLERRFQKFLRRSPYEEILRLRLERVKQLLTTTDLSIAQIADQVGFSGVEYLSAMFKRKSGLSPREFRRSVIAK